MEKFFLIVSALAKWNVTIIAPLEKSTIAHPMEKICATPLALCSQSIAPI